MGNIGQNINAGGEVNVMRQGAMKISCPYGKLDSLNAFGLSKDDEANARMMADSTTPSVLLYANCGLGESLFASASGDQQLLTCFEQKCRDEAACEIQVHELNSCFNGEVMTSFTSACSTEVQLRLKYSRYATDTGVAIDPSAKAEPVFLAQATCMAGKLVMPLIGV